MKQPVKQTLYIHCIHCILYSLNSHAKPRQCFAWHTHGRLPNGQTAQSKAMKRERSKYLDFHFRGIILTRSNLNLSRLKITYHQISSSDNYNDNGDNVAGIVIVLTVLRFAFKSGRHIGHTLVFNGSHTDRGDTMSVARRKQQAGNPLKSSCVKFTVSVSGDSPLKRSDLEKASFQRMLSRHTRPKKNDKIRNLRIYAQSV